MLGLFVLVLSLVGIVRMARTRGASPWLYGLLAGVGWLVVGNFVSGLLAGLGFQSRYRWFDLRRKARGYSCAVVVGGSGGSVREVQGGQWSRGAVGQLELSELPFTESELCPKVRQLRRSILECASGLTCRCSRRAARRVSGGSRRCRAPLAAERQRVRPNDCCSH